MQLYSLLLHERNSILLQCGIFKAEEQTGDRLKGKMHEVRLLATTCQPKVCIKTKSKDLKNCTVRDIWSAMVL